MLKILLTSLCWLIPTQSYINVTNSTDREQKWQCHYPRLLPGGPGSPWLPVRPAGPAGPVGPFIPETSNSQLSSEKNMLFYKVWCRNGLNRLLLTSSKCWLNSWEYPLKYLGILERLEPQGHPSFHWDLDDQDPPEEKSCMLFFHPSSSREPAWIRWLGDSQAHWGLWRAEAIGWEHEAASISSSHRNILPRYWGMAKERSSTLLQDRVLAITFWFFFYCVKLYVPPKYIPFLLDFKMN